MGSIISLTFLVSSPIVSAIVFHVFSISSTSSIFNKHEYGPNFSHMESFTFNPNFFAVTPNECLKVSIYEVAVPLISHGIRSKPIPVSITVVGNSSKVPS